MDCSHHERGVGASLAARGPLRRVRARHLRRIGESMTICIIDGANFLYRSRSGFQLGDFNVAYNFFRALRPLVEKLQPNRVYFTMEGTPKRQLQLLPEYKANRGIDVSTPEGEQKYKSLEDFWRQRKLIMEIVEKYMPISVVHHPDYEADDLVYNLVKNGSSAIEYTVVSSDSDFTQMLQEFTNVRLYNPISKTYVEAPDYSYVTWKALRGDGTDNIPGLLGVNDQLAEDALSDPDLLKSILAEQGATFARNMELIQLHAWSDEDIMKMRSSSPVRNWDAMKAKFTEWAFKSITKDGPWDKFVQTFDPLFG
jgi:5'-3' exonuclease